MNKLEIKQLVVGQIGTNCYLVTDRSSSETFIIDPGDDADYIGGVLRDANLNPAKIIATHGHFDHVLAVLELKLAYGIPFLLNEKDEFLVKQAPPRAVPEVDIFVKQGDSVSVGRFNFLVIETPGHTPGSVSLYNEVEGVVFCGDVLFAGDGVGRTDFSYADQNDLSRSIQKILALPGQTAIYSGHGEETRVATERERHGLIGKRFLKNIAGSGRYIIPSG